jgi:hypothetical protein
LGDSGREIKHVGSPRRAEVFPPDLEIAAVIVFQFRMIASQAVIAHLVGTWVEVRNENAGVVPTSTPDNLAAGERIHPAELGTHGQFLINPPCLQRSMV